MDAVLQILASLGVFIVGVGARLGLVVLAGAVLLVPALFVAFVVLGSGWIRRRAQGVKLLGGLCYRPGLLYAGTHTWVRREKGEARVGVDDLVRHILPWAVSVQLPRAGSRLRAGDPAAVISSGTQEAVILSPIDGTVVMVNERLVNEPSLLKRDAYSQGWLFLMHPWSESLDGLRGDGEAQEWLAAEGHRLQRWVESRLGTAAADGGELVDPIASHLDSEQWKALTRSFLE